MKFHDTQLAAAVQPASDRFDAGWVSLDVAIAWVSTGSQRQDIRRGVLAGSFGAMAQIVVQEREGMLFNALAAGRIQAIGRHSFGLGAPPRPIPREAWRLPGIIYGLGLIAIGNSLQFYDVWISVGELLTEFPGLDGDQEGGAEDGPTEGDAKRLDADTPLAIALPGPDAVTSAELPDAGTTPPVEGGEALAEFAAPQGDDRKSGRPPNDAWLTAGDQLINGMLDRFVEDQGGLRHGDMAKIKRAVGNLQPIIDSELMPETIKARVEKHVNDRKISKVKN